MLLSRKKLKIICKHTFFAKEPIYRSDICCSTLACLWLLENCWPKFKFSSGKNL